MDLAKKEPAGTPTPFFEYEAKPPQVPKLGLDRLKANPDYRRGNPFYPLTDPERGRKGFLKTLNLTQQELNNLSKQTSIKNQLRMALVIGDHDLTKRCSIMKFQTEMEKNGFRISEDDYAVILLAFCIDNVESKEYSKMLRILNHIGNRTDTTQPLSLNSSLERLNLTLNYEQVIRNIVPIVSKKAQLQPGQGFSIGWTVSKQAKIKAMRMSRQI